MQHRIVVVGLAEALCSANPNDVLVAYALGSCIGLALWDPAAKVGCLAHVLLPGPPGGKLENGRYPAKFADSAVKYLIEQIGLLGGKKENLTAKIAGGATIIKGISLHDGDIGRANALAVTRSLREHGIEVKSAEVGGTTGKTMRLYISSGDVTVASVSSGERLI